MAFPGQVLRSAPRRILIIPEGRQRHPSVLLIVVAVIGWLTTGTASAHRDRGPNDPCRRQIGNSLLHLTLYQPQFDPVAEYCEEVPRAGKTIMAVDFAAGDLRRTPVGLEVIETRRSGDSLTVLSLPAETYELGVVDTEATLDEGHDYRVRVSVGTKGQAASDVLIFPIRVTAWYRAMLMPALFVVGLLMLMAISIIRYLATVRRADSSTVWASRQPKRFA